jgi:hypothetical protein
MSGEEDWLLRPVLRGLCRYESLLDGKINLVDIAKMNEALDVEAENQERVNNARKR